MGTALLVIDMQNDFCSPGGFYAARGRPTDWFPEVAAAIGRLAERFREAGDPVVYTRLVYPADAPFPEERHAVAPARWTSYGERLRPGSWGAGIVEALVPAPGDVVVDKRHYSAFAGTDLAAQLAEREVDTVVITGVVAYACVLHTAFDAFVHGLDVVVPADAVDGWEPTLVDAARGIVELLLGRTTTTEALLAELASGTLAPG